jgi:hypothetical protein
MDKAHLAIAVPKKTRRTTLETYYFENYGSLLALANESEPSLPLGGDVRILQLFAEALERYRKPLTQESLNDWATRWVIKESASRAHVPERSAITEDILREHGETIHFAVKRAMKTFSEDCAVSNEDVENEIGLLIFQMALKLSQQGTAKLSNRLRALIKRHCYGYHIRDRKRRLEIVTQFQTTLGRKGIEILTPMELAQIKADEMELDGQRAA